MNVTTNVWLLTLAGILALIVFDFVSASRKAREVSFRAALWWSMFYISLAIAFGVGVWSYWGSEYGEEFFAAYLVEKSLSVDNLFVFAIILTQFAVPKIYHQRVLLIGVALALVLRAIFIAVGAAALSAFAFTFVIFGALLIWTGFGLLRHWNEDPEPTENALIRTVRKFRPVTDEFHGTKLFANIEIDGVVKRAVTPMLLVMLAIASTDLLFALDSIPATFGVTSEPFLVFTANAFALLGLRALYFLLKGLLDKLVYLSIGLAVILMFIGVKLILVFFHEQYPSVPKIETSTSLIVIGSILAITTVASIVKSMRDPSAKAHAGRVTGRDEPVSPGGDEDVHD